MRKKNILIFGVGLLVLFLFFKFLRGSGFSVVLKNANFWLVGLAFSLNFVMIGLWTWRWDVVLKEMKYKLKFVWLYLATLVGNFGDTISPGARMGGEPFRAYIVEKKHKDTRIDDLAASLVLERIYNTSVFFAIATISIIFILFSFAFSFKLHGLLILILVLSGGLMVLIFYGIFKTKKGIILLEKIADFVMRLLEHTHFFRYFEKKHGGKKRIQRIFDVHVRKFFKDLSSFGKEKGLWTKGAAISLLYWFVIFLQAYLCFMAVGVKISFLGVIAIISISSMAGIVTLLPSGIGVTEIIQTSLALLFGINLGEAGAAILLVRGNYYLFGIFVGYITLLIITKGKGHKVVHKHLK
jgi:hypothetical protein